MRRTLDTRTPLAIGISFWFAAAEPNPSDRSETLWGPAVELGS